MPGLETPGSAQRIEVRKGQNLVREFDRLKSRLLRIKIGRSRNTFVLNELRIRQIAGMQRAFQRSQRRNNRLAVSNNDQSIRSNRRGFAPSVQRSMSKSNFPMIIRTTTGSVYYPVVKPRSTIQIAESKRVQYVRRFHLVISKTSK